MMYKNEKQYDDYTSVDWLEFFLSDATSKECIDCICKYDNAAFAFQALMEWCND